MFNREIEQLQKRSKHIFSDLVSDNENYFYKEFLNTLQVSGNITDAEAITLTNAFIMHGRRAVDLGYITGIKDSLSLKLNTSLLQQIDIH